MYQRRTRTPSLLRSVPAPFSVESVRIAPAQLLDVVVGDLVHRDIEHSCERGYVPEAIAEFLYDGVAIERRVVEEVFLDEFGGLAGLACEAECRVGELLLMTAVWPQRTRGQSLVFSEIHLLRGLVMVVDVRQLRLANRAGKWHCCGGGGLVCAVTKRDL